jgi:hypothetical protein
MIRRFTLFIIILLCCLPLRSWSQNSVGKVYAEVRNYTYNAIRPIMRRHHDVLMDSLTDEELSLVRSLRADMLDLKNASGEGAFPITLQSPNIDQPLMDELFPFLDGNLDLINEIMEDANRVVSHHQPLIDSLYDEMAEDRERWKNELRKIVNRYRSAPQQIEADEAFFQRDFYLLFKKELFVLWHENGLFFDLSSPDMPGNVIESINFYPTPPDTYVDVEIKLYQPATVEVKLFQSNGREIRSVEKEFFQRGTYMVRFDLEALPALARSVEKEFFYSAVPIWFALTWRHCRVVGTSFV